MITQTKLALIVGVLFIAGLFWILYQAKKDIKRLGLEKK